MAGDSEVRAKVLARLRQRMDRLEELLADAGKPQAGSSGAVRPDASAKPPVRNVGDAALRSRRAPQRASA